MMTIEIRLAINAYSMAVAARLFKRKANAKNRAFWIKPPNRVPLNRPSNLAYPVFTHTHYM